MLDKDRNSTLFMVPGPQDEPKHFLGSDKYRDLEYSTLVPSRCSESVFNLELSIAVVEIRGNGVLDTVGGEIWEACLLLCAFILLYPNLFVQNSVLELGSGLGLPGLLVTELQSLVKSPFMREVCLSDNDPRCVESLIQLIQGSHWALDVGGKELLPESNCENKLTVIDMDWSSYVIHNINPSDLSTDKNASDCDLDSSVADTDQDVHVDGESNMLSKERFQILMGSALCYSPYHICLADTVKHFLDGSCEEVIVIQISDRAGYSLLLDRLSFLNVEYTVEEVSEEIYETAQLIGQNQCIGLSSSSSASSSARSHSTRGADEGEVRLEKKFTFPSHLVQSAVNSCRAATHSGIEVDSAVTTESACGGSLNTSVGATTVTDRLISTDRESFKILRARKHVK